MKKNINKKAEGNMSKYYCGEKLSQERLQQNIGYFPGQCSPKQIPPYDYLREFNLEAKAKIFNAAYSCIDMFYRIIDETDQ